MKIIDRYIFSKLIPMFLVLFVSVILITCLSDYLFNDKVSSAGLSFGQIFFYYTLFSVLTIKLTLPSIMFIATILVVLRISNNCELVACLSNGVTYKRFLKPFMLFALLLLKVLLLCEGWLFPIMNDERYEFERKYFSRREIKYGFNIHLKLDDDKFFFVQNYDNKRQIGYLIFIDEIKDNKLVSRFSAERMVYEADHWTFYDCQTRVYEGREHTIINEDKKTFDSFNITPDDLIFDRNYHKKLTTEKLNSFISRLEARGVDTKKQKIEQMSRLQRPFLIFVIMILAVLFSSNRSRMGISRQLIIGFIVAGSFIFGAMLLEGFAYYGNKNIIIYLFSPIVLCAILDVFLYRRVQK